MNYRSNNLKIKTNETDEAWEITFEFFGLDMVVDLNDCIYVLAAEDYYSGLGYWYYGDLIISKYNNTGDQLWSFNLEGLILEESTIAVDSESNLYLASMYENQTITSNMILFKFNNSGELKWQKTWEGGTNGDIVDIRVDSNDSVYIYGTSNFTAEFKHDLFIVKYNTSGEQQWFHLYEALEGDYEGWDLEIDSNNNIIVSGFYYLNGESSNWIRCYNQSGILKWEMISEQGGYYDLAVDSLDNMIVVGRSYILKYNNLGDLIWGWEHHIEFAWEINIAFDSFDNIYAGAIISIPEDHHKYDLYVVKINNSGNFDWYLTWGGLDNEDLMAIDIDSNNNIYLLSDHNLIKNPETNGKSLANEKLWSFYMIMFSVCFCISPVSLIIIVKRRINKKD